MHSTLTFLLLPSLAFALALPAQPSSTTEVQQYAQCGGTNYSGATSCASGLMCKAWNPYYSQCIPAEEDPAQAQAQSCSTSPTTTTTGQTGTTGQSSSSSTPSQESSPSQSGTTPSQGSSQSQNSSPPQNTTPTQPASSAAPKTSGAAGSSTGEKTYTLDTFIQFLEEKAGNETASMMKRLVEELMMD